MDIQPTLNNSVMYLKNIDTDSSGVGQLAAAIAYFNFEWRFVTVVMFNAIGVLELLSFLMHYNQSVIVKWGRFTPRKRIHVHQYVIFGESTDEIITTLRWMVWSNYDSSGKYIIVCPYSDLQTCDEREIFQCLSKLQIVNVVLLKKSVNNEPLAFSYDIVKPEKCINGEPELLDWLPGCKNITRFKSIFKEKFRNFYKCHLYISTLEQRPFMYLGQNNSNPLGGDGELIKLVANVLNATLKMQTNASDIGHYEHDNWTGCLGDTFNSRAHASMCVAPLTSQKYGNFQISTSYFSMDIVWATKVPELKPGWEKIVRPLKKNIRYILLFMFMGIVLLNKLMTTNICRKVRKAFKFLPFKRNLPFYSWLIFLGMPLQRMPSSPVFKILIYTLVWFCFIIRSGYQAALISSLKQNIYYETLISWRDVVRLPYGGPPALREYYIDNLVVYNGWTNVSFDDTLIILDKILNGTSNFVLAVNKDILKYHVANYNGSKYLEILPEYIVRSPTVIYFKKFSPLTEPVNEILQAAREGGLIQHFYKKYLINEHKIKLKARSNTTERLKLQHFNGCFMILCGGYILSFIYFLVEVICGNLTKTRSEIIN